MCYGHACYQHYYRKEQELRMCADLHTQWKIMRSKQGRCCQLLSSQCPILTGIRVIRQFQSRSVEKNHIKLKRGASQCFLVFHCLFSMTLTYRSIKLPNFRASGDHDTLKPVVFNNANHSHIYWALMSSEKKITNHRKPVSLLF